MEGKRRRNWGSVRREGVEQRVKSRKSRGGKGKGKGREGFVGKGRARREGVMGGREREGRGLGGKRGGVGRRDKRRRSR
jgi:hypothetical protein